MREQFILVTMRFKRIDICSASAVGLQQSELAVMERASTGCTCDGKGLHVSEIQKTLPISKPAVSQTLNALEKKGYISRTIDSNDRRKIAVTPTPMGEEILAEAKRCYFQSLDCILERFGKDDVKLFIEMANRLIDIFEEE